MKIFPISSFFLIVLNNDKGGTEEEEYKISGRGYGHLNIEPRFEGEDVKSVPIFLQERYHINRDWSFVSIILCWGKKFSSFYLIV